MKKPCSIKTSRWEIFLSIYICISVFPIKLNASLKNEHFGFSESLSILGFMQFAYCNELIKEVVKFERSVASRFVRIWSICLISPRKVFSNQNNNTINESRHNWNMCFACIEVSSPQENIKIQENKNGCIIRIFALILWLLNFQGTAYAIKSCIDCFKGGR